MRLATLIISLALMLGLGTQSCTVAVGGSLSESFSTTEAEKADAKDLSGGGGLGMLAAVLWLFGAAFVMTKPKASAWLYATAAVFCLIGASSGFTDLYIWAAVSVVFAVMSWGGVRELRTMRVVDERAVYRLHQPYWGGTYYPPPPITGQFGPGWWLASDGQWYPPQPPPPPPRPPLLPPPSPSSQPETTQPAPGWWQASDGNWYPPS